MVVDVGERARGGGGGIKNVGQHGWATTTKNFETALVKFGPENKLFKASYLEIIF